MKNIFIICVAFALSLIAGCGPKVEGLEKEVTALEAEATRVKDQKTYDDFCKRAGALSDKLADFISKSKDDNITTKLMNMKYRVDSLIVSITPRGLNNGGSKAK